MSRLFQDSFISDDEEEVCPLCVEEFDISDKGFKPCPCGYQVCQFCYNNIRQNPQLNGRCPGCRRPYDDESVEYRVVTAEEWRQDHQKQTRREKEKKMKEKERKEIEQASRKHLSGMRVIQKNLVYVVGLNPHIPYEELHNTLRGDQFFGQYGKIQKIVVNRRNGGLGNGGIGVYVTYYKKEDAARCIAAVDGSSNDGKLLRAAYGTTKYCSSYLRNQPCPNPNCMFLHEPGEEADSYTRQDLSTIQHAARQGEKGMSVRSNSSKPTPTAPTPKVEDHAELVPEVSALPPTVSWASKASPPITNSKLTRPGIVQLGSRTTSMAQGISSGSNSVNSSTSSAHSADAPSSATSAGTAPPQVIHLQLERPTEVNHTLAVFENALKVLSTSAPIKFSFSAQILAKEEMVNAQSMPPLFAFSENFKSSTDMNGTVAVSEADNNTTVEPNSRSRYTFLDGAKVNDHFLDQQQMMQGVPYSSSAGNVRGVATPPPGLFGNNQQEGQEILSMLGSSSGLNANAGAQQAKGTY
ncbi:uncharacterized protein V1516DRAFT_620668 [Lipomyces oligophaga]|uniref:uncharacterized protein n=1 Tax=Lipomyces oligophaga TaxID=45792 RepID=UPI0034CDEEC2